jgi:hypothetical protein
MMNRLISTPMNRRAVLAGVPTALLMGGCTDLITGEEARFEAETATVTQQTLSETNYQEQTVEEDVQERTFEQVDRTVVVVNMLAEYSRSVNLGLGLSGELARFTVLASPQVELAGQAFNPLDDLNNQDLALRLQEQYDNINNIQSVDERDRSLLGETVTVSRFEAEAQTEGEGVEVFIHIAQAQSESDFIVALGVHPKDVDETDNIDRLLEGVQHPA